MFYRKLFAIGALWGCFTGLLAAQTVQIVEEETGEPIENVYVYNDEKNITRTSDRQGEIDFNSFKEGQFITFQHPSYVRRTFSYTQIAEMDFIIRLTKQPVNMEEVFVSASKWEQDVAKIPQKISRISPEEIERGNPQTSADILQQSGKVFVQKSQLGGGSPMIRGFSANSVLLAVDGIRMNNAIFRSGNLQNVISLDANALENTEIIFGPGSIIYGSDALGGVMNFQTKEPRLTLSPGESRTDVESLVRFASANNERTAHANINHGRENWGVLTSVTYSNFDDLRSGSDFYDRYPDWGKREEYVIRADGEDRVIPNEDETLQRFSGYEQLNMMQKIRYRPISSLDIDYGLHFSTTSDIPRYDRLIERRDGNSGDFVNAEWYYGPQIWLMNALKITSTASTGLYDRVRGTFSHQWFQESRNDRKFQDDNLRNREENVAVIASAIDFDKRWGEEKELFYGIEASYNNVSSSAQTTNIQTSESVDTATRYPAGGSDYTQFAGYLKYQQDLTNTFTGIIGARYSHIFLDSNFGSRRFYDFPFEAISFNTGAFSGSAGFTYRPASTLQFNMNASSGFRAPNVDDAAKVFDSEPGNVVVPNHNIKPEYSYNLDFTVIARIAGRARLEMNTFYTWLKDAMVRRDYRFNGQTEIIYDGEPSRVQAVVNAGKAYIYGAGVNLSVDIGDYLEAYGDLSFTQGRDLIEDLPLRHVAPLFGQSGLTVEINNAYINLYAQFNSRKTYSQLSPSERNKTHLYTDNGTPGWITLNAKASYRFNSRIRVDTGLENILDKHYRPYSSGISAPGRNVIVALRANI